ncbi:MAG: transcriptional repressor [Muribaculaceae bacterium]|nr:transcriptional repressor [Muribaculaceae bacterium]
MTETELMLSCKGVKPTANRLLIYRQLEKASHPLSLSDLEELLEFTMDKASIFRVLELFTQKDVVHAIEDGTRSVKYELCPGSGHNHIDHQHPHFYCEKCHSTYCFEDIRVPVIEMPDEFNARSINYVIKGVCPKCKK